MSKYTLHSSVLRVIDTLKDDDLKELVKEFINYTPIDFVVNWDGAFRTAEEQNEIFLKGFSKCDGYVQKSAHQTGMAVDLVPWLNGKTTWDLEHARALGAAFKTFCKMKGFYVVWGGDWYDNGVFDQEDFDPYHFEGLKKI